MRHRRQSCLRKEDLPDLAEDSEEAQMVLGADHGVEDKEDFSAGRKRPGEADTGNPCLISSDCGSDLISIACHPIPGPPSTSWWYSMSE